MADVEERRPEAEEVAEAGLKAIATGDILANNAMPYEVANGNGHGLHQNGDTDMSDVSEILEFDEIGSNFVETNYGMNEVETGESSKHVGEVVEEETVELEFEKVKPKLATHSMHCPNCKSEVTKVILRRKLWSKSKPEPKPEPLPELEPQPEPEPEPESEPEQETKLVGCLACLSFFTRSDNGNLKLFDIFPKRQEPSVSTVASSSLGKAKPEAGENDSCFSLFWVIGSDKTGPKLKDDGQPRPVTSETIPTGTISQVPRSNIPLSTTDVTQNDPNTTRIDIPSDQTEVSEVVAQPSGRTWLGYEGVLAEILKSIVYGGLMEVIASLSVVASAAASDADTLSIISLALASVIGGVFVIGHNIWDLRDDCHKAISSQETNNEAATKYKELLGQVNYFPLHAFFALLSFIVFGIVPPVAYGISFHETNDNDFTLVVVASASLLCVLVLATFKAYINRCNAFGYLKTVVYYITTAVSVSGVSYVVGDLVSRLMEEYGLFDPTSSILPSGTTQSLAYF